MADGSLALGGAGASGGSWSFGGNAKDKLDELKDKAKGYMDSVRGSITPSFLRGNEAAAVDQPNDKSESLQEKEQNVLADSENKIKNAVQGITAAQAGNYGKALASAKKAGPIMGIMVACVAFAFMAYSGLSLMPFSLVSHLKDAGSSAMETSISRRSDSLLKFQMTPNTRKLGGYETVDIKKYHFAAPAEFAPKKKQIAKLADKGITFDEVDGVKVMKYQGRTIVPDEKLVKKIPDSVSLDTAIREGGEFSHSYLQGTMTWRGKVRYWFDTKVGELLLKLKVSRNKTKNIEGDDETSVKKVVKADEMNGSNVRMSDELDTAEEGKETVVARNKGDTAELDIQAGDSDAVMAEKVETLVSAKASKMNKTIANAADAFEKIANASCLALNLASSVTAMMKVLQMDQIRQAASMILEAVDKAQIGENQGNVFNVVAGMLGKVVTTSYKTEGGGTTELTGAASQGNLILSTYEDLPRAPDASVNAINPSSNLNSFWRSLGNAASSVSGFVACASIKMAAAVADAVGDAYDIGSSITEIAACVGAAAFTYGTSCAALVGHIAVNVVASIAASVVISGLVQKVTSWLVPKVANIFVRDAAAFLQGGHDTSNGLAAHAFSLQFGNSRLSGLGLLSEESYGSFKKVEREYLAEKAHYERQERSPFDPTSEYTFLGSLLTKFGLLSSTVSSPVTALASLGSTAVSSIDKLMPHASAVSDAETLSYIKDFTERYCPGLAGIGALARDSNCDPIDGQDTSTLDDDPVDCIMGASKSIDGFSNFEEETTEEGVPVIKQNSDLMKYILSVVERQSDFGIADQNLASTYDLIKDGTASSIVGAVPVIGSGVDLISNANALNHVGYISGRAGVVKNDGTELGTSVAPAKKVKQYACFIGDQRIMKAMNIIENDAVSAALEKYYEEHPLDNSLEGVLARKTGMTKEKVIGVLSYMKLASFMDNYEPAEYAPYIAIEKEQEKISIDDDEDTNLQYQYATGDRMVFVVRKEYYIA